MAFMAIIANEIFKSTLNFLEVPNGELVAHLTITINEVYPEM